jgi:hypothetical protein
MIRSTCWETTIRVPPKPKSITVVFVPKVRDQMRVFLRAQRLPSIRQLRRLLPVPMNGTILSVMTSSRRLRACGLPNKELRRQIPYALVVPLRASRASHCTTVLEQRASIRAAPDPRPRHPIPLALEARLDAGLERCQKTSSVRRIVFISVEA